MTGRMRYRASPDEPWVYVAYTVMRMAGIVLAGLEYQLEGRDYFDAPTHWGTE
ncbi:hypothetical protein SEA_FORK_113 [Microbacterium phage Fork]|nr:hypothetical protein SEA_FORK_1 [Microbacterium phage Fork]QWS69368.1 hypothetical protein SEA_NECROPHOXINUS_2 [Microbacterium phage Necrophoxinus]WNO25899.1 hypothetical protein SEA_ASEGATO_1 [Microbacterium phage ASegato]AXC36338.1 hypothetical protein SEA_FORK_113 [Microbacterium phage Fork]QWS69479.1 hypothetical protein SEA_NECROPHOXINUS_118 [Microbacterium phage Necrophoxinus]